MVPPVTSRTGDRTDDPVPVLTASRSGPAQLSLDLLAPKAAGLNQELPLTVRVANAGGKDSQAVTVRADVPDGAEFVRSDPPPAVRQGSALTWAFDPLAGGKSKAVQLVVRPTRKGTVTAAVSAETADGQHADQRAAVAVSAAGLKVAVEPPVVAGDKLTLKIAVTNTGAIPADAVTAWVTPDAGLTADGGGTPAEVNLGTVPPGETRRGDLRLSAASPGRYGVRVNVVADGGLTARTETIVDARRSELAATVTGPDKLATGEAGTWEVRVTNAGEVPASGVTARATLPAGLTPTGDADWQLGTLAAGEQKTVRLTATADRPTDAGTIRVTAAAGDAGPRATASAPVDVAGRPTLVLDVADPPPAVPVGQRATVRVTVRNTGTGPARRVEVAVSSAEMTARGGTGPDRQPASAAAGRVTFPPLDELAPGKSATFTAELEGAKPGTARILAEVRADHLPTPLRDEQSTHVTGQAQ